MRNPRATFSDYTSDMSRRALSDHDVERLYSGKVPRQSEIDGLARFVDSLRSLRSTTPRADLQELPAQLADVARHTQPISEVVPRRPFGAQLLPARRFATAAIAVLIPLVGISGIAIAANGSAPGEPLHGVDLFLEKFGIGNGGETERIAEADTLFDSGDPDAAFVLLGEYLEQLDAEGDTEALEKVERHIELATTKSNPNAAAAQEKVARLKAFIEINKGDGVGLDGKEFGQGVSEIARSKPEPEESGPPDEAGPKEGKGNAPDHAGPKNTKGD